MSGCCDCLPDPTEGGGGTTSPGAPEESIQINVGGSFGGYSALLAYPVGPDEFSVALKAREAFGGGSSYDLFDSSSDLKGQFRYIPDELLTRVFGEFLFIRTGYTEPVIETENGANQYALPQYGGSEGDILMGYDTGPDRPGSRFNASLNFSESPAGRDRLQILGDGGNDAFATFAPNGVEKGAIGFNAVDNRLQLEADGDIYQWPAADGAADGILVTDGAGGLSFSSLLGRTAAFALSTAAPGAAVKCGVALGGPPSDLGSISGGNTIDVHLGPGGTDKAGTVLITCFGKVAQTTGTVILELWSQAGIYGTFTLSSVDDFFNFSVPLAIVPGVNDEISLRETSTPGPGNLTDCRLYLAQLTP